MRTMQKIVLFITILSSSTAICSEAFETKLNLLYPGVYIDGNSIPVEVAVKITLDNDSQGSPEKRIIEGNHTFMMYEGGLYIPGSLKEYDVVKFTVTDARGNNIAQRASRHTDPNFFESRVQYTGDVGRSFVDLHDWFELDKEGLYFVSAEWQFSTDNGKTYTARTDKKPFRIISAQGMKIYELTQETMCMPQATPQGYRPCVLEIVTIGEPAIPYISLWLWDYRNKMPWTNEVSISPMEKWSLLEVVSQIGSEQGRKIIAEANNIDESQGQMLLKRIDIWQSPDRYDKLIAKLSTPDAKWAIYKLGILGDTRAIPVLEQIAEQNESLDIRETAKDAIAHLKDPSVPMYYRRHDPSEKIVVSSSKTTYKLGESIEIRCKLIAGPYGSTKLKAFSTPAYHFLPWGISSEPFRIAMRFDIRDDSFGKEMPPLSKWPKLGEKPPQELPPPPGVNKFGMVAPLKELQSARAYMNNWKQEPPEGYVTSDILGASEPLNLGPNETREYAFSNLNQCFHLITPRRYMIYVNIPLFKAPYNSNQITIKIIDPNSK
jgi:hypothetical protein